MNKLYALLYVLGAIMFLLSMVRIPNRRIRFLELGLFFWILVPLIQTVKTL